MRDFTILENGTCLLLKDGLSDDEAMSLSLKALSNIFNFHPDMNPSPMDDVNILVRYNRSAANVVLHAIAEAHWPEIEARHLDGLTTSGGPDDSARTQQVRQLRQAGAPRPGL
jgi:hypothetical protein